jgi:hypothetical protein
VNALRAAWEWAKWHKIPLAYVSVAVKGVRAILWLPLLYYLIPASAPTPVWLTFWGYFVLAIIAWFIDSVLDADGSGT